MSKTVGFERLHQVVDEQQGRRLLFEHADFVSQTGNQSGLASNRARSVYALFKHTLSLEISACSELSFRAALPWRWALQ